MEMVINNKKISYIQYGQGKDIVLLHGWGQNIMMMKYIGDKFANDFRITILDLPGFGASDEPDMESNVTDYEKILELFLKELSIDNPILIGHSFGGRIAIIYASKKKTNKLVLLAAPMIKRLEKQNLKMKTLKGLAKIPLLSRSANFFKKHIGSSDYKNSSLVMRKVLVNTVNTDLEEYAKKITVPTIYIIGDKDSAVSVDEAKKVEEAIPNCGLIIYNNATHYAYLEQLDKTVAVLNEFLKEDKITNEN